jgi:hypothetical protein
VLIWRVIAGGPYLPLEHQKVFKDQMKRFSVLLAVMVIIMSGCIVVPYHDRGYYYGYPYGYYEYHRDWGDHRYYRR